MYHTDLRSVLRHTPLLFIIVFASTRSSAQTTDEWVTSWLSPSNNVATFARNVASSGSGNYVMASDLAVYRTVDAGQTWTMIDTTRGQFRFTYAGVAYPSSTRILTLTDSIDYIQGGEDHYSRILVSTDAGATWMGQDRIITGEVTGISMFDDRHGLVGLNSPGRNADSLLVTSDGGVTWSGRLLPPGAVYPYAVYAVGRTSWYTLAFDSAARAQRLYRTTDAGANWSAGTLPEHVFNVTPVDEANVWGVGLVRAQQGGADTSRDIIVHSTDGGATWTTALDRKLRYSFGVYTIAFADANNGIAGGGSGQLYRTTDGGVTWESQWMHSERRVEYSAIRSIAYPVHDEAIGVTGSFGVIAYRGRRTLIAPDIVSPKSINGTQPLDATIRWTSVSGATGYDVQVADTVFDFDFVNHRYFDEPYLERTNFADTSLDVTFQQHKLFVIRVRARNDSMVGDWSQRVYVRTVGVGKTLARPNILAPTNGASNVPLDVDLTWSEVPDAVGYDFRVALESTFLFTHKDVENHQGTTTRITGMRPNQQHWVRVRARDADGVKSEYDIIVFRTGGVTSADGETAITLAASLRPNSTSAGTRLHLSLHRPAEVRLDIIDVLGTSLRTVQFALLEAGTNAIPIDVSTLASGEYIMRISAGDRVLTLPLIIAR